jgi:hypothetical protein
MLLCRGWDLSRNLFSLFHTLSFLQYFIFFAVFFLIFAFAISHQQVERLVSSSLSELRAGYYAQFTLLIFFTLPFYFTLYQKVERLVSSSLSELRAGSPLTASTMLRMINVAASSSSSSSSSSSDLPSSSSTAAASKTSSSSAGGKSGGGASSGGDGSANNSIVKNLARIVTAPMSALGDPTKATAVLYQSLFAVKYLREIGLVTKRLEPSNLAYLVSHLHYHEVRETGRGNCCMLRGINECTVARQFRGAHLLCSLSILNRCHLPFSSLFVFTKHSPAPSCSSLNVIRSPLSPFFSFL